MNWLFYVAEKSLTWANERDDAAKGAVVTIAMVVGTCLPIAFADLAVSLDRSSRNAIAIGPVGLILLLLSALLTIMLSVFVGGVTKALLSSMASNWVIGVNLATCIAIGLLVAGTTRELIEFLSRSSGTSGVVLFGFVVLWSAMALNMLKTPWDDLRDRISNAGRRKP